MNVNAEIGIAVFGALTTAIVQLLKHWVPGVKDLQFGTYGVGGITASFLIFAGQKYGIPFTPDSVAAVLGGSVLGYNVLKVRENKQAIKGSRDRRSTR